MREPQPYPLYARVGDTFRMPLQWGYANGDPVDLDGASMRLTFTNPSKTVTFTEAPQVEITDASAGEMLVHLQEADTLDLGAGAYEYKLRVETATDKTTLLWGVMRLSPPLSAQGEP